MSFDVTWGEEAVTLRVHAERGGLVRRLLSRQNPTTVDALSRSDRELAFALADLRALADDDPDALAVDTDTIRLSHALVGRVDSRTAASLGLPPLADLVFRTDVEGVLGSSSFRLTYEWAKRGMRQFPTRTGSILETADGPRRLPLWMQEAIGVADAFDAGQSDAGHWEALARFRQALDPGIRVAESDHAARVSMTDFLQGLEVRLADRFAIAPVQGPEGLDFDVVPFSGRTLAEQDIALDSVSEAQGELREEALHAFQSRVRTRGSLPAYRVGNGSFLVIDHSVVLTLDVMARMQHASPEERAAFVKNPRPLINDATESSLRADGKLDGLSPAGEQEMIEAVAGPQFIETTEYSDRVIGTTVYEKPSADWKQGGTVWLPETYDDVLTTVLQSKSAEEIDAISREAEVAVSTGRDSIEVDGQPVPATKEFLDQLKLHRVLAEQREQESGPDDTTSNTAQEPDVAPIIVETKANFDKINWRPEHTPRQARVSDAMPDGIQTPLKRHQIESLQWQIEAWKSGLPGVLNADEQGLGKTLQTIAFIRWLQAYMEAADSVERRPVLVVAPTSLLEHWEAEVRTHLEGPGLGHLMRLYGSGLGGYKRSEVSGVETAGGQEHLDFSLLHEAISEERGNRFWMLTTYTTLTNYQHSLARVPFCIAVFDEIQALKNPRSLRAHSARAVQADFRIGLTGTPIENSTEDLWAIMDQLCPGAYGTLADFRTRFGDPDDDNMQVLHERTFASRDGLPPLALRRMKESVARDLPEKTRRLHPRPMPQVQAAAYERARASLKASAKGAALKVLHHIRSVSVHPALVGFDTNEGFVAASARLEAAFEVLRGIEAKRERALVFIEHVKMQYRFVELVKNEFGLAHVDVINGQTPIQHRQVIVNRFQRHLLDDQGFDVLVLGPRAAGVGLTLTAATHVLHLSRWWNPAVEEQCNDRVHRLGQTRPVTVHVPMAIHPLYREQSFDCLLHSLMSRKRRLASYALWPMGDTRDDAAALQSGIEAEVSRGDGDVVELALAGMFERDGVPMPARATDGSLEFS